MNPMTSVQPAWHAGDVSGQGVGRGVASGRWLGACEACFHINPFFNIIHHASSVKGLRSTLVPPLSEALHAPSSY